MTIDARCLVCRNPDRRRAVELMWNGGMSQAAIVRVLDTDGIASATITRHLKEHSEGDGNARAVVIEPEKPVRERVMALRTMQLDEIERRIELAKQKAEEMNRNREKITNDDGTPLEPIDWSHFVDILGKDFQAAISSILKSQGLDDKREKATNDTKLGLFEAMARAGLAPKALSGKVAELPAGEGDDEPD